MRVLSLSKSTGGLATYNEQLATGLARAGIEVEVACLSEGRRAFAERLRGQGLRAHEIDMARFTIRPLSDLRTAARVLLLLRGGSFDAVIGQGTKAGFLARLCGRIAGVPAVYKLASLSFERRTQGRRASYYRALERLGSRFGGSIVTVCNATRAAVIDAAIAVPERVRAIHTGVDVEAWGDLPARTMARLALGLEPNRFTIGWAARMDEQKDPHRYLDAIRTVSAARPEVQTCMAGEGALRSSVEERVRGERLPIVLLPWQSDMRRFLAAVDVFVLTSRWEGLPIAVLEAMAAARAVVATPVDGTPEVIRHDVDGLLAASAEEIAASVLELANDPGMAAAIGNAGRTRVESSFGIDAMLAGWLDLLHAIAGETADHRPTALASTDR